MSEPRCARCGIADRWVVIDTLGDSVHEDLGLCIEALGEAVRALQASRQSIYRVRPSMDPDRLDSKGRLKAGSDNPSPEDARQYEPQPEGGEATEPAVGQRPGDGVAPGASAGSNVDAPEQPHVDTVTTGKLEGKIPLRAQPQKLGGGQADLSGAPRGAQTTPIPPDTVEAMNRAPEPFELSTATFECGCVFVELADGEHYMAHYCGGSGHVYGMLGDFCDFCGAGSVGPPKECPGHRLQSVQHVATEDAPEPPAPIIVESNWPGPEDNPFYRAWMRAEPPATERERDELDEIERLVGELREKAYQCGAWRAGDSVGYHDRAVQDGAARAALMDAIRARLRAPQGGPPDQPIHTAPDGMVRFVANPIVRDLLDHGSKHGMDMNDIAARDYPRWARVQFAQLIGYSLRGYSELSYVSDADYERAERAAGAPQGEPDPDLMEAWADWYDEHRPEFGLWRAQTLYKAGRMLREFAVDLRAHRDATGDTP